MSEIKYVGQMSSSQNSRVIDPSGISYAVTNGHKDGEQKIIERDTPMKGNYTEPDDMIDRLKKMIDKNLIPLKDGLYIDCYNCRVIEDTAGTITARVNDSNKFVMIKNKSRSHEPILFDDFNQRIPENQNVIGTITTNVGNSAPRNGFKVAEPLRIPQATAQGYVEVEPGSLFDGSYPNSKTRRGRVQDNGQSRTTLTANGEPPSYYEGVKDMNYRIRKLTPRECFRLMGVSESDIDKIQQSGVSQTQQYKMAGNSIVVDVLEHIFRKMFVDKEQESQQLRLF